MPQFFLKIFDSTIFLSEFFNHRLNKSIQGDLGVKLKMRPGCSRSTFRLQRLAVAVCVSLCAPVAAYGQITFLRKPDAIGWATLFKPEDIGLVSDP
jgi:hypothetical protein